MAAVTTDIRPRRPDVIRIRHLASVPALPVPRVAPTVYRLRRAVALAVAVGIVVLGWAGLKALGGSPGAPAGSASAAGPVTVEVAPGDTFWSIASRLQIEGDPRALVDRLVAAHGGAVLRAGERLAVDPR